MCVCVCVSIKVVRVKVIFIPSVFKNSGQDGGVVSIVERKS